MQTSMSKVSLTKTYISCNYSKFIRCLQWVLHIDPMKTIANEFNDNYGDG
jgi:hypothetical protein